MSREQDDSHTPLNSPPTRHIANRFHIQSVHDHSTGDDELDGSLSDLGLNSHYASQTGSLASHGSVGNTSIFSQLATDLISGSQANLPWLTEPGSALGSSLLLASRSYLDIYADASSVRSPDAIEEETEDDIFDNPEYIDTLEGRLPLAEAARMIAKDSSKHEKLFSANHIKATKRDCYTRFVIIGISFLLLFSSSFGIRNAISSLGHDRQLSLIGFGLTYSLMWFGGVCTNPIIAKIRPKWALVLATTGFILLPVSMFHMSYYTTLPACIYHGFSIGLLWGVEGVYLINTASTYSLVSGEPLASIVRKFNTIILSLFLCSNILGNLLSTLLLGDFYTLPGEAEAMMSPNSSVSLTANVSSGQQWTAVNSSGQANKSQVNPSGYAECGLDFYEQDGVNERLNIYIGKQYILFGVYTLLPVLAALNITIFLRKLKVARRPGSSNVLKQLKNLILTMADRKSLLLIPLTLYLGLQNTTILADYNASFISCAYGVDKIGYVVMATFALSTIAVFLGTKLVECMGRVPLMLSSFILALGAPVSMLLFNPVVGTITPLAFIGPCLWGISDFNIFTQTNSLVGDIYRKNIVHGITMITTLFGTGAMTGTFIVALGVISLTTKIYLNISASILAAICYLTLELLLKNKILS